MFPLNLTSESALHRFVTLFILVDLHSAENSAAPAIEGRIVDILFSQTL